MILKNYSLEIITVESNEIERIKKLLLSSIQRDDSQDQLESAEDGQSTSRKYVSR